MSQSKYFDITMFNDLIYTDWLRVNRRNSFIKGNGKFVCRLYTDLFPLNYDFVHMKNIIVV